jgi:hypothetical protein
MPTARWVVGYTWWGEADIYYLCSDEEWDGNVRMNGQPVIQVAPYMKPEVAERIVELHNRE